MKKVLFKILMVFCLITFLGEIPQFHVQAETYYDAETQTIKLLVGDTYKIEPQQEVVKWESSDLGIVTVDENGTISSVAYTWKEILITGTHEDGSEEVYTVVTLKDLFKETEEEVTQFSDSSIMIYPDGYDMIDISVDDPSLVDFKKSSMFITLTGKKGGETTLRVKTEIGEYTCKIKVKSRLAFNRKSYTLERGETEKFTLPSRFETCIWENSDESVVELRLTSSQNYYEREVVAKKAGTATISVTNELGEVAETVITVTQKEMTLTMDTTSIEVGDEEKIYVDRIYPWNECTYKFDDPSIAELDSTSTRINYLKALKAGDTILTVTNKYGESASINVHIYKELTLLKINEYKSGYKKIVYLGRPEQLSYTAAPADANNKIKWYQDKKSEEYFTISSDGLITPIRSSEKASSWDMSVRVVGECLKKASCDIEIKAPYFSAANYSIYKNEKINLASKLTGGNSSISWTSSNPSVASVDANGVVTALKVGEATITANSGGYEVLTKVIVNNPKLSEASLNLYLGESKNLTVIGAVGAIKWESSDTKVAAVSANGNVAVKKIGTATITATVSGEKLICKVKVLPPTLNVNKKTLIEKQTCNLQVKGGTGKKVWKSSNKSVAVVNSKGKVTAKKVGKTTISVKVNGRTLKCKLAVKKNQKSYSVNKDVRDYSYGSPHIVLQKVYYSGNSLKAEVWVMNNRMFRADKFSWLNYEIYDDDGKLIAKKKFTNIRLGIAPYRAKKITLTFSGKSQKKKNVNLTKGVSTDWDFYYYYTY